MKWRDKSYVDLALPFGLRSAPLIFNSFADMLEWLLRNNVMADGCTLTSSNGGKYFISKDCPLLHNVVWDNKKLKWKNDLDSLKIFFKESIGVKGKWSSPGGGSKKFKSSDGQVQATWYYKKQQTLLLQEKDANILKENLIKANERKSKYAD